MRGNQYVNMNLSNISKVQINSNYLPSTKIKNAAFFPNEIDEDRFTYVTLNNTLYVKAFYLECVLSDF